jgi:hypothetical protein
VRNTEKAKFTELLIVLRYNRHSPEGHIIGLLWSIFQLI